MESDDAPDAELSATSNEAGVLVSTVAGAGNWRRVYGMNCYIIPARNYINK